MSVREATAGSREPGARQAPSGRLSRVCWIAGRPAAGKSTLARRLLAELESRGIPCSLLDSDEARRAITPAPSYSDDERLLVYRALAYTARRLAEAGPIAIVAATTGTGVLLEAVRRVCPDLFLVHARCGLEAAVARDPKGLYAAARAAPLGTLPGVGSPYEIPEDADREIDTERPVPDAEVAALADALVARRRRPAP